MSEIPASPTRFNLEAGHLDDDPSMPVDVRAARAWHRAMARRGTARDIYAQNLRMHVRFSVQDGHLWEARARLAALLAYADFPFDQ